MTGQDICIEALTLIRAITPGQTPQPEHLDWAFSTLNRITQDWTAKWGTFAWGMKAYRFPLTPAQGEYTMGPGGDFDMPRPEGVQGGRGQTRANIVVNVGPGEKREPLYIMTPAEWNQESDRTRSAEKPNRVYIDGSAPKSNVSFLPIPSSPMHVEWLAPSPISKLEEVADDVEMPETYRGALVYTVAEELNLEDFPTPRHVIRLAGEKRQALLANNCAPGPLVSDIPSSARPRNPETLFKFGGW